MKKIVQTLFLFVLAASFTATAQDGKKMTFQGSLFQSDQPFNGTTSLEFSIILDSANTWTETIADVNVINGLYSVVLGKTNPLPSNLFAGSPERQISIKVDGVDLGKVTLYEPFGSEVNLPLDLAGPNGKRSVMLSSEGENGNDGTFRLGNEQGASRVTMYANAYSTDPNDTSGTRNYSGAGGVWFGGGNGSRNVQIGPNPNNPDVGMVEVAGSAGSTLGSLGVNTYKDGTSDGVVKFYSDAGNHNSYLNSRNLLFNNDNGGYPGWFGTYGTSGFSQLVGYDSANTQLGAILSGFWNGSRPSLWMEDGAEQMGVFLALQDHAGMLQLQGKDNVPNIQMGPKDWEDTNLPYMVMRGTFTQSFSNDNGTPSDTTDDFTENRYPDLMWTEVQRWDDGTELGNITLRGTDGSEFNINSHGMTSSGEYRANEASFKIYNAEGTQKADLNYYADNDAGSLVLYGNNDSRTVILGSTGTTAGQTGYLGLYDTDDKAKAVLRVDTAVGGGQDYGVLHLWNSDYSKEISLNANDGSAKFSGSGTFDGDVTVNSGRLDLKNTSGGRAVRMQTANDGSGSVYTYNGLGNNNGWFGSYQKSGFVQLVGNDDSGNTTGAILAGFWNGGKASYYMEDANAKPAFWTEIETDGNTNWGNLNLYNSASDGSTNDVMINLKGQDGSASFSGTVTTNGFNSYSTVGAGYDSATSQYAVLLENVSGAGYLTVNSGASATISLDGSSGTVTCTTLNQTSDRRYKKNIQTLEDALSNTLKMRGVSYNWKDKSKTQRNQIGVIAQEVEEIYPEFVHTDENGMKSVNYSQMTAVLIEAVKELNAKIDNLQSENSDLKAQVANASELESRLAQIEKMLGMKASASSSASSK